MIYDLNFRSLYRWFILADYNVSVLLCLAPVKNIPPRQGSQSWLELQVNGYVMCEAVESFALSTFLVAILRRIKLLVLVIPVWGQGGLCLVIAHQAIWFSALAIKHKPLGAEYLLATRLGRVL